MRIYTTTINHRGCGKEDEQQVISLELEFMEHYKKCGKIQLHGGTTEEAGDNI